MEFSSYDGDFWLPLVLAQGSPIFHSSCEGELGVALESLQGIRDLIYSCVQDLMFLSRCGELPVRTGSFVRRTQLWELPQSLRVCLQT